ncbi:MAG TPA: Wzz/FepE/Etk N-terminal domain-containing protein [Blastocatellia bacterium]|nr:Wzz/FepE/Etk N-terminal domain-containing protein [Blastocatellia bacterium]
MGTFRPRSVTEYLQVLWRRKLLIFLVAAVLLISTFFVISKIPDIYESRASVVVAAQQADREAISSRVAAITERLTSRSFLETVIERHGLYPSAVRNGAIDSAVGRLRKSINVETRYRGDRPETLIISYRNSDPVIARTVNEDLVSLFGNMNDAIEKQRAKEIEDLNTEIAEVENQLNQKGQQRAIAAARRGVGRSSGNVGEIRARRQTAIASLESLSDKQFALERQIAEQKQQIAEQQKIVKSAPSDARSGSSYGVLLVRKAELEAQIQDFTAQYTDKNPKVMQAKSQLAEINRQIAQLSAGDGAGAPANSAEARELRAMQRELSRLETELEITRRDMGRKNETLATTPNLPAVASVSSPGPVAAAVAEPATDVERLRNRYTSLLNKQDALARMQSASVGLDPGLFQIVDQPTQPQTPAGPDRMKLRMLALLLALGAGLAAAVAIEAPRLFAIRDDRDVQYYLGAPVIAQIPETLTPAERGRSRKLLAARSLIVLLLAVITVPALIFLLNQLQVFQILASRW